MMKGLTLEFDKSAVRPGIQKEGRGRTTKAGKKNNSQHLLKHRFNDASRHRQGAE